MDASQDAVARHGAGNSTVSRRGSAIWSALVTALACSSMAVCGWTPFGLVGSLIRRLLSPGGCTAFEAGTMAMYVCSAKVALLTITGPIGLGLLLVGCLVVFRRWTAPGIVACASKVPAKFRYIVPPVFTTLLFTITWAGTHYGMAFDLGILPQILFPVVIGLLGWALLRYDPMFRQGEYFGRLFAWRDRVPLVLRVVVALLVSALLSLSLTFEGRVTHAATKEQIVVVFTLVAGYTLLWPKRMLIETVG